MPHEGPRKAYLFHSSAWDAYFRGNDVHLRELVDEEILILTADLCLLEIVSWLSELGRDPTQVAKFIGFANELVATTPDLAVNAACLDHARSPGERLTLAIAAHRKATAVFWIKRRLVFTDCNDALALVADHTTQ